MTEKKRVSIFDVAKEAGCSIATVSNALNSKGRIGVSRHAAVLAAVERLGYVADTSGRSLRLGRTEIIGLLFYPSCARVFRNPYYAEIMEHLEDAMTKNRHHLLLAGYEISKLHNESPIGRMQNRVDGVILLGAFPMHVIAQSVEQRAPLVLLDTANDNLPVDSVTSDGFSAASMVVDHLVSLGHSRVLMVAYKMEDDNIDSREQGFLFAVRRHGLESTAVVHREYLLNKEICADLVKRMAGPNAPTAISAVNDTLALAIRSAFLEAGYRIPQDVSLVGFDDDEFAVQSYPDLTTVRVDRAALGQTGAHLIFRRIADRDAPVIKMRLPTRLIVRGSTMPPAKHSASGKRQKKPTGSKPVAEPSAAGPEGNPPVSNGTGRTASSRR